MIKRLFKSFSTKISKEDIMRTKLIESLKACEVKIVDTSGGCISYLK